MKIQVAIQFDLSTGDYDVRCDNLTQPGTPIDVQTLTQVVGRIMTQLKAQGGRPLPAPQAILGLPLVPPGTLLS